MPSGLVKNTRDSDVRRLVRHAREQYQINLYRTKDIEKILREPTSVFPNDVLTQHLE